MERIDLERIATRKVVYAPIKFDVFFADNAREPTAV